MKIKYYRVRRNQNAFWEPTKAMRAIGFANVPLGPDGPSAWTRAHQLNKEHQDTLEQIKLNGKQSVLKKQCPHKKGTLNALYWRYTHSTPFNRLKPSSRKEYARAWRHIGPELGDYLLFQITEPMCERFHIKMEQNFSESERCRTIRILRKMFNLAEKHKWVKFNPATSISNPLPEGRTQFWFADEIHTLIATAHTNGYQGMSIALRIMWDTLMSPIDIRTLTPNNFSGDTVHTNRKKTNVEGIWTLAPETMEALKSYLSGLGCDILPDHQILRMRSGGTYRNKDTFAKDFRAVRKLAFPNDKRRMMDIRRSGNLEAALGGASPKERAELLANGLDKNKFLEATYTPANKAKSERINQTRIDGRKELSAQQIPQKLEHLWPKKLER